MKIISLEAENKYLGWKLEKINFNENLTLLVGASGVGKTQILKSINSLKDICEGKSISGFKWNVEFNINNKEIIWQGEFKKFSLSDALQNIGYETKILSEYLYIDNKSIINRNENEIIYQSDKLPKLSPEQSTLYILREEEIIQEIVSSIDKIILNDNTEKNPKLFLSINKVELGKKLGRYEKIENINNINENIILKLFLCYELKRAEFEGIKNEFINIFPQVQDIKIEKLETKNNDIFLTMQIQENNTWIFNDEMSSGMLRTFIHIAETYLLNDGSVILIDEFENSLGINCIDILTQDLTANDKLQFILTSHHPYIINNIPYEYWKIVKRKGGIITTKDAKEYKIGVSKQQAFLQLTKILQD